MLFFQEAMRLLRNEGFPLSAWHSVASEKQLEAITHFPVVLKVDAPALIHKSDVGCVKTNITTKRVLRDAYQQILKNAQRQTNKINSVIVQPQYHGHEVIIGLKKDATFGHVALFGLGGVYAEIFHDTTLRILPFTQSQARAMIDEIKSSAILHGVRGQKPVNISAIVAILMSLNRLVKHHPEISELDFNPVIVDAHRAVIVDARVII